MTTIEMLKEFRSGEKSFMSECVGIAEDMENGKHPAGCCADGMRVRILIEMAKEWFDQHRGELS